MSDLMKNSAEQLLPTAEDIPIHKQNTVIEDSHENLSAGRTSISAKMGKGRRDDRGPPRKGIQQSLRGLRIKGHNN